MNIKNSKYKIILGIIMFLMLFFIDTIPAKALTSEDFSCTEYEKYPDDASYGTSTEARYSYSNGHIYVQIQVATHATRGYDHVWMKNSSGTELHSRWVLSCANASSECDTSYWGNGGYWYRRSLDWVDIGGAKPSSQNIKFSYVNGTYTCDFSGTENNTSNIYHDYEWSNGSSYEFVPVDGTLVGVTDYITSFYYTIDKSSDTNVTTNSTKTTSESIDVTDYFTSAEAGTYYIHMRACSYTGLLSDQTNLKIEKVDEKRTVTVNGGTGISSTSGGGSYYPKQTVSISATPSAGYYFSGWTRTAGSDVTFNNSNASSTSFTMPDDNTTVQANAQPYVLSIYYHKNYDGDTSSSTSTYMYKDTRNYDDDYSIKETPSRPGGYTFVKWSNSPNWNSGIECSGKKKTQEWATTAGGTGNTLTNANRDIHIFAQWKKTITYTFAYWDGQQGQTVTANVEWHNADTSNKTMTIPSAALGNKKRNEQTWTIKGFDKDNDKYRDSGNCDIAPNSTVSISVNDKTRTVYAKYETNVVMTYVDYGTDEKITNTDKKTAYMNWNYTSHTTPEFAIPNEHTMKYTEATAKCKHSYNSSNGDDNSSSNYTRCKLCKQETWDALGWSLETESESKIAQKQGVSYTGHDNVNKTFYGRYSKDVTLTYDYNKNVDNTTSFYTRNANAFDVSKATVQSFTLPLPTYRQNGVTKYSLGGWTGVKVSPNNDFNISSLGTYTNIVGENDGNEKAADFKYTPRVSETIYAAWTNQTAQTAIEPKVNVVKSVIWENPSSDNSSVDYDGLQNIDTDGNAVVTLDITVKNTNGYNVSDFKVDDYINTDMWTYKYDAHDTLGGVNYINYSNDNGSVHIELPSINSSATYKVKYTLQLKEPYWNVTEDTKLYTNKIPDVTKYLNSLTNKDAYLKYDSTKNYNSVAGIVNYSNMYYCENQAAEQSYVKATYHIKNGRVRGTERQVRFATPYIVMRQVNWIPTTHQVGIESDTNNIYHNIDSSYKNTYFVRYDTKGTNSTFRLYELSQLKRSYTTYQITNNLMDMKSVNKTQEVIDNSLGISIMNSINWSNTTSSKLSRGFKALDLLKISAANNVRSSVTTNGVIYPYGSLTTYDTDYATNQDGLKFSVYPFVRITNSKQDKTFETTRDTSKLADKRLDLTIDATDPIITADSNIKTKSDTYGEWTESDGYMDINLVNKATNPTATSKELTFKFEDKLSGVNSPYATSEDWINTSRDNVQVTLKRVDNESKTIFDSNDTTSNDNKYVKVTYDSTNTMNKTGNVKVKLDPEDKNVLGHLQLTICVYDNVGNWTEKTYDLYVFCLTGAVEITDSLLDYSIRQYSLNQFRNGEMGVVKVSAGGYADRVTVDFGTYLDKLYKNEYDNYRGIFANDNATTINGDYPNTDAKNISGTDQDSTMTYLPYNLQVNTWGYTSDTLGGIELKEVNTKKTTTTIDNTALRRCLDELIERYQGIKNGKTYPVKEGSIDGVKYAIVGSTLYTYPVMNGNTVRSYADKYELGGETYYNEILYPAYITLDGTKGIDIIYNTVEADNTKMSASVESTTEVSLTNWIAVGNSYFKPFKHYFYVPLEANKKTSSDPYYVTLTEYKDSEKSFKHSVSIKLSFTNDNGTSIINDIKTYIKDN